MLTILRLVAAGCGPLIWYDGPSGTPLLVTAETDIAAALAAWEARRRVR